MAPSHMVNIFSGNPAEAKSDCEVLRTDEIKRHLEFGDLKKISYTHFNMLIFITDGNYSHTIDDKSFSCKTGNVLLVHAGQMQQFQSLENCKGYFLLYTKNFLYHVMRHELCLQHTVGSRNIGDNLHFVLAKSNALLIENLLIMMRQQAQTFNPDELRFATLGGLLRVILLHIEHSRRLSHSGVENDAFPLYTRFVNCLEMHFQERRSVERYARELSVTPKLLNEACKSATQNTVKNLIDAKTIIEAERLLNDTELNIKIISSQLGFEDATNFGKFFRKKTGIAPGTFRTKLY